MAKKSRRKKSKYPPLSKLDCVICGFAYTGLPVLTLFLLFSPLFFIRWAGFSDPSVVAVAGRTSGVWVYFSGFAVFCLICVLDQFLAYRQKPIFGNPHITYGSSEWADVYPLFDKRNYPQNRIF